MTRPPDFVLQGGRIHGFDDVPRDIAVRGGRIAAIAPHIAADGPKIHIGNLLVTAGFVESHIHLDKSCLQDRCNCSDTLAEAIKEVSLLKSVFTVEDVYERGRRTLEKAIVQGTTRMRTHVEVDPRAGLRSFEAVRQLKRDYAWAIEIEICVFPQEGLLNDPGTDELLVAALEQGADLIGGCPYTDSDPHGQIARIFELASHYDVDLDFHLDFDLDASRMDLVEVCRQAALHRRGGRVAVGHVSKLSAAPPDQFEDITRMLSEAGVAVTVLPATDLFLMGQGHDHLVPRGVAPVHRLAAQGVTCSISTNNVLNPFTPFGDCSMVRMANLYANIAQLGRPADLAACFEMITTLPARLMNKADYGIRVGNPADLVVINASSEAAAVGELAQPLFGIKAGRSTFTRPEAQLHIPDKRGHQTTLLQG
ncbi:amidohydrolase family protein [Mesorhizobium xinjiangense]|uniref:amidohydrolase family protein n=1 Tax=Mesorhizobium xinjiangense TaxID=2678685 RepID=UPI0012EDDCA2|nr:amidohydrolase family protein [Mesorhizobium xinjiangense]